ncbi:MAG: universal stress protein [Thermoleophilia bacterium]|nr:universal stress protein [Thermoleophilia bacterium]
MTGYRSIAVCTDGATDSTPGLAEARVLLAPNGTLRLVHVTRRVPLAGAGPALPGTDAPDPVEGARAWLEGVAAAAGAEPVLLVSDTPAPAVAEWAAGNGVGLLVAAPRRSRLERAVLGSFTSDLAHGAPCPVLITRAPAGDAWGEDGIGTVAAVVDEGPAATLVAHAARTAGGDRLVVAHALDAGIIARIGGADMAAPGWLIELAEGEDADEVVVVAGGAREMCEWAKEAPAGLLVVAARNAPGPARLGSFTSALAVHAPCPVLVARAATAV